MAPQEYINAILFFTDCLTESDTSIPNSAFSFSNTHLDPGPSHSCHDGSLYQAMASNDGSTSELLLNNNNYIVEEDNCLGIDDVTPPKGSKTSVKRHCIQLF
ncbi:hypothetical protein O181_131314 [Austropuccinia psidii MF-1]|uniref:Uncharacterized protein n=1 Tax=Austropuccinia psidii MF-1 TaxID=1389203 RepID=A0A9Q3L2P1_9BASI|nr:hypothetical protein [Austropuccinia psidii MF-1]